MRVSVIINPLAGLFRRADQGRRHAEQARTVLASAGVDADVQLTTHAGHARALAETARAHGTELVFAWGGDGTVNEVASVLAFGDVPLAIVPVGSGNGLARALGIPRRPAAALRHALAAPARRIDAGEVAGHLFFNVAGVGFDAHIAAEFGRASGHRGFRRYAQIVTRELFTYAPRPCEVMIESVVTAHRAFLLTAANGPQWGNGAIVAPEARIDDGLLDLVSVEAPSRLQLVGAIPRLFAGTLHKDPIVHIRRVTEARISSAAPLLYHYDGEPARSEKPDVLVRVHPGALLVRA